MAKSITRAEAIRMVENLTQNDNGVIFTVEFIKRTPPHETRLINCRGGVHKGVQGIGLSFDPVDKGLFVVYDMQKEAFRLIPEEGLRIIRAHGKEYIIKH